VFRVELQTVGNERNAAYVLVTRRRYACIPKRREGQFRTEARSSVVRYGRSSDICGAFGRNVFRRPYKSAVSVINTQRSTGTRDFVYAYVGVVYKPHGVKISNDNTAGAFKRPRRRQRVRVRRTSRAASPESNPNYSGRARRSYPYKWW